MMSVVAAILRGVISLGSWVVKLAAESRTLSVYAIWSKHLSSESLYGEFITDSMELGTHLA